MRVFALTGTEGLGKAVAEAAGVELHPLEEREFADGEHKSRPLVSVRNQDVYVIHSLHGHDGQSAADRLVRLLFFIGTCRDNGAARITAVVPYFAFMRKEVQTKPRDPVTTRYMAQLLEAVGTEMVVGLEVHNPAAFQNAFRCRTVHLNAHRLFAERIAEHAGSEPVVFLAPDGGAIKRTHQVQQAYEALTGRAGDMAFIEKHRSNDVVSGGLFAGEVADADVVIVDDMISTGGTILRAARAARERGARRIFAVATHALTSTWSPEFAESGVLERIIVTDSAGPFGSLPKGLAARLDIVSCAPLVGDAVRRLHGGGSITRLLNPRP